MECDGESAVRFLETTSSLSHLNNQNSSHLRERTAPASNRNDTKQQSKYALVRVVGAAQDPSLAYAGGRKNPMIVHVSMKSRCLARVLAENLDLRRFKRLFLVFP